MFANKQLTVQITEVGRSRSPGRKGLRAPISLWLPKLQARIGTLVVSWRDSRKMRRLGCSILTALRFLFAPPQFRSHCSQAVQTVLWDRRARLGTLARVRALVPARALVQEPARAQEPAQALELAQAQEPARALVREPARAQEPAQALEVAQAQDSLHLPRILEAYSPICRPAEDGIAGVSWLPPMRSAPRRAQALPGLWRRRSNRPP